LRNNRNYRNVWVGQVVSEVGDHFNNIAVMSLAMEYANPGLVVTGVFLMRAIPMLAAGPIAGVLLDRLNRKHVMIASDLARAAIALAFILCLGRTSVTLLYALSAALMFASPFFTSGRSSVLPGITTPEELHTANTMTQTTAWASLTLGGFLGAVGVQSGYRIAFVFNALSFLVSAFCISRIHRPEGFRAAGALVKHKLSGLQQYREGLRYIRSTPLISGIMLINIGWASGGGAAQILFSLFAEKVFHTGPMGIGLIWSAAGVGLLIGGAIGYALGKRLQFVQYKRAIAILYVIHGAGYILFSQMPAFWLACIFIAISRSATAVSSVMNFSRLLRHSRDEFRGRVFATMETLTWSVMMVSMMLAGAATIRFDPRAIGTVAGILSSTTGIMWAWLNWSGRLPEPPPITHTFENADEEPAAVPA
jgi:MFS family permease